MGKTQTSDYFTLYVVSIAHMSLSLLGHLLIVVNFLLVAYHRKVDLQENIRTFEGTWHFQKESLSRLDVVVVVL